MANMEDIYDFYNSKFSRISFDDAWSKATGNDIIVYINTGIVNNAAWVSAIQSFVIGHGDGGSVCKNISFAAGSDVLLHKPITPPAELIRWAGLFSLRFICPQKITKSY